ncbi:MAG: GntR family transcriptional regulator [Actinomycetota bacterium]|nr:GntR family transcriptional regulator [Actinomycetota bacterium]
MPAPTSSRSTAYRAVAADLRALVTDGGYGQDQPLPTEMDLAQRYGVCRQTVRRAFLDLVNEGLVNRVAGRGTFVRPAEAHYRQTFSSVDDLLRLREQTEMRIVTGLHRAPAPERAASGWSGRYSWRLDFVRSHQGTAFCHTRVWLPPALGERLTSHPDLVHAGTTATHTIIGLIEAQGFHINHAVQATTARAADAEEAEVLGCAEGSPLLEFRRTYLDDTDTAIEHAESLFLPAHYTHTVALSRRGHAVDEASTSGGTA